MENTGLGGVTVRLSGMAEAQTATDNNGQYAFTGLRSGTYSVEISGFDSDEVGFGSLMSNATVGVGESKIISFDGTYLRTAGIMGQVSVEGVGLAGVTVTMTGEGEDETDVTDAGGLYGFSKLKAGAYSVAISGYDPDEVEFGTTSMNVTIALGETANIPFNGTLLRTSGISGRVSLDDGTGLDGVTVTLAGAAEATAMTSGGGQYAFAGLAEGAYVVSMTNPNADAYTFETMSATIVLGDSESNITNFEGTHTRTASVSGVLFIDEVMQDKMLTTGEPSITAALAPLVEHKLLDPAMLAGLLANAKVMLRGPDLATMTPVDINADGTYTTGASLQAGSYQVELPANNEMVAAALAAAGVAFVGESAVVMVDAGGSAMVNFPFRITMQTIGVGAVMGKAGEEIPAARARVKDVELELYATAQDADAEMNPLSKEAMKTNAMGMAGFTFARADDSSPAGEETDNLVFVKVKATGHDDLMVSDNPVIEIRYPGIARVHSAPAHVRLLNVGVSFDFWVKSTDKVSKERGGDMGFGGWHTEVFMGEVTDESMPLMKPDPEDDMKMVNATERTDTAMATRGKGTFSYKVDPAMLAEGPAMFTVRVTPVDEDGVVAALRLEANEESVQPVQPDGGEMWTQSDALVYPHDGLALPDKDAAKTNDRGPIRITYTTQTLTVGVYRETDDEPGFSNYQSKVAGGDQRPSDDVADELEVEVMVRGDRNRLETYDKWDDDGKADTDPVDARQEFSGGLVSFARLSANMKFTVRFTPGSDRVAVGGFDGKNVETFGQDLGDGMSRGGFGADGGAMSEARLCPLSDSYKDDKCSTFAYQWNTGEVSGKVARRGAGVGGAAVNLDAVTSDHSPSEKTKSSNKAATRGNYSFSRVQDGDYWLKTPKTADHAADSVRLAFYHDETMDDDDDDGVIGKPVIHSETLDVTALRLGIKGYVANVGHEDNQVVRGDETVEGAALELWAYDKDHKTTKQHLTKGSLIMTAETGSDGFYEFNDIAEGTYVVIAKSTDDYEVLRDLEVNGDRAKAVADVYEAVDETNNDLSLPSWNYRSSSANNPTNTVTLRKGTPTSETFTFQNFALLHMDGEFLGRVYEARDDAGDIAVELRRCETVTGDVRCREETEFDAQTENTSSRGTWAFDGLREGFYAVNVAATNYRQAKWDSDGIDDDAVACDGSDEADANCDSRRNLEVVDSLVGKRAFNRERANFYVYNSSLGDDAELDGIVIEGTTDAEDGDEELADITPPNHADGTTNSLPAVASAITWASEEITVTPDLSDPEASVRVVVGDLESPDDVGSGGHGDDITVDLEGGTNTVTVIVTAENGYHDIVYSFAITRTTPVDAQLAGLGMREDRDTETGNEVSINPAFAPATTEYTASVSEGTGSGTTMSVYVLATVRMQQQDITVTYSDGGTMTELDALASRAGDGTNQKVYRVTIPKTGALPDKSVLVKVTSEDGKTLTYDIQLQRGEGVSSDATLSELSLTNGVLSPVFASGTLAYTASVGNAVTSTTVTATPNHSGASVTISPATRPVPLKVGETTITITVTAENRTTKVYTVVVTRDGTGPSSDATLRGLSLSNVELDPEFAIGTEAYTASVGSAVTSTTVTATATHSAATVLIVPATIPVPLKVGETTITATVTASNRINKKTYTVVVTRADGPTTAAAVKLVLTPSSISENGGVSDVTATVSPASATAFDMTVSAAAVDPAVAGDYNLSTNTTLSFAANAAASTGAVTITAVNNNVNAADKTVTVSGAVPTGMTAPADQTLTIEDDDVGSPTVTLSLSPMTISEKDDPATRIAVENVSLVRATLSEAVAEAFTVTIALAPVAPAVAGDYITSDDPDDMVLSFAANATTSTGEVAIEAIDNDVNAPDKEVTVSGTASTNDVEVAGPVTLTIEDDDDPLPEVTLHLGPASISEAEGKSAVTASLSAVAPEDFTVTVSVIPVDPDGKDGPMSAPDITTIVQPLGDVTLKFAKDAASSTGVVTITALDNDLDAPDITVTVKGTTTSKKVDILPADGVTLTITDDDEKAGVPQRVTLASGASGTVTLSWFSPRILGTSPVTGYEVQHRVNTGNREPIEAEARWTDVGIAEVLTRGFPGLTDGLEYQFWVRAVTLAGPGEHARLTGRSWPVVMAVLDDNEIDEADDPDDAGDQNVAILTLTGAPTAIAAYSVSISTSGVNADAVELEMTEVTFEPGETEVEVKVTAVDDELDNAVDERPVTIELKMLPVEAADREIVVLTITVMDDDIAPAAPAVTVTADGSDKILVEWVAPGENGSADITHYEFRYMEGTAAEAFEDDEEDVGGWKDVPDGTELTRAMRISDLEAATAYVVQVRAVSSAGESVPGTDTATTAEAS